MAKKKTFVLLLALACFAPVSASLSAPVSSLKEYLVEDKTWHSPLLDEEIAVRIYFDSVRWSDSAGPVETIVYVKNTSIPRVGHGKDEEIIESLITEKCPRNRPAAVVTLDYRSDDRARPPQLEEDLWEFHRALRGHETTSIWQGVSLPVRRHHQRVFFIPSGWRVDRNRTFWKHHEHGAEGTTEELIRRYNEHVAGPGKLDEHPHRDGDREPVESVEEMVRLPGEPLDLDLRMDVVYPSGAKSPLPVMMVEHTNTARNPSAGRWYRIGFPFRGYVYANVDHNHCPVWRAYYNFSGYSLSSRNGLASATAAVRFLRANVEKYNISADKIGAFGHSRASYPVMRLTDPDHAGTTERHAFEGHDPGPHDPQPWQGHSSEIAVAYYSMGWVYWNDQYLSPSSVPAMVVSGEDDGSVGQHRRFVREMEALDIENVNFIMEGLGHTPPHGYDKVLGRDRYELFCKFFDYHLKPEMYSGPLVLYITPHSESEEVSARQPVEIQFAGRVDEESVIEGGGIKVLKLPEELAVEGSWEETSGNTRFSFTPEDAWEGRYVVKIEEGVRGKDGSPVHRAEEMEFSR